MGSASENKIILYAADAETAGHGIDDGLEPKPTDYDASVKAVTCVGADSTITYTVPAGIQGNYDLYLNMGRTGYAYGTTPVGLSINGEKRPVLPIALEAAELDGSNLYEMGRFLLAEGICLRSGSRITVCGNEGFSLSYNGMEISVLPAVGDLELYPAGRPVAIGYDHILPEKRPLDASDPLFGLKLLWLGSSVTYGDASGGYAMAEEIPRKHPSVRCYKYAVSGTTLANDRASSYVQRMLEIDPKLDVDFMIVQLSTNDATQGKPMGCIAAGKNLADFDDTTILGAMETIIAYGKNTWNCPVIFYTGTYYASDNPAQSGQYALMVEKLLELQKKWDIGVIDLWHDKEMTQLYGSERYHSYMRDPIHPNKDGYISWWTPKFESYLIDRIKQGM